MLKEWKQQENKTNNLAAISSTPPLNKLSFAFSFLLGFINLGNTDLLKNASPDFKKGTKTPSH